MNRHCSQCTPHCMLGTPQQGVLLCSRNMPSSPRPRCLYSLASMLSRVGQGSVGSTAPGASCVPPHACATSLPAMAGTAGCIVARSHCSSVRAKVASNGRAGERRSCCGPCLLQACLGTGPQLQGQDSGLS